MSDKGLLGEVEKIGERLLTKLKDLARADSYQIVSFIIILIFIAVVILMISLACCHSCCTRHTKKQRLARVQPQGVL